MSEQRSPIFSESFFTVIRSELKRRGLKNSKTEVALAKIEQLSKMSEPISDDDLSALAQAMDAELEPDGSL